MKLLVKIEKAFKAYDMAKKELNLLQAELVNEVEKKGYTKKKIVENIGICFSTYQKKAKNKTFTPKELRKLQEML